MKIWELPSTEKDAIEFLQERGLLHKTRKCRNGHEMKLYHKARPVWECKPCKQQVGVRVGSWFVNTKLPFLTIVRFIYCWSKELTSIAWCEEQLEISLPTAVDWNMYLREICIAALADIEKKIGGENMVVERRKSILKAQEQRRSRSPTTMGIWGHLPSNKRVLYSASMTSFSLIFIKEIYRCLTGKHRRF